MKTKSKRFLNLATLCLALLGTTLLMGQPVKAEAVLARGTQQTDENAEAEYYYKEYKEDEYKEYMMHFGLDGSSEEPYYKGRFQGRLAGYKEGLKGSTRPETKDIQVPDGFEGDARDGYKDGYEEGFGAGEYKRRLLGPKDATQDTEHQTDRPSSREGATQDTEHQTDRPSSREGATQDTEHQTDEPSDGEDDTHGEEIGDMILGIVNEFVSWFFGLFSWG
ncbi:hypothetical membrane associated protein [Streptococcus pyogenes]|uniref:hypothetical protein n=1 Tax=Streptococcus pyogenes TaxID=1314 RepID=UPI00109C7F91|nr:hypothetical protein [Streptococcus pyogenes]VGT85517.1 hypothetical membrane associated protein [Streptococcus pyogenes]